MKVAKNYIYNLSYQLLVIVLPIITIPYISRVLGAEGLGLYTLTYTYAQYFVLFGMLGLSVYSSREVAYVRENKQKLYKVFWEINILRFITMGISLVIYLLLFKTLFSQEYRLLYLTQVLIILSSLIDISWFFIGLEDFKKVVIRNTTVKIIGVILIFLFVKNSSQIWLYSLIIGSTQLIGQIVMWIELPSDFRFVLPEKNNLIEHLKNSFKLFIPQISINVYTMVDKIMLGTLANEAQVGIYDNSQKIIRLLVTVVTTLAIVTVPKMANLYKMKKYKEFTEYVYKSFSFVSFISFPMTFGLIGISKYFVPIFYGSGFEEIIPMFYVGSFLMITLGWSSILGNQVLISIKREGKFTIAVTAGAIINVLLNIVLIKKFQGLGTTISSVVAEYTGMFFMLYFLKDMLSIKKLLKITLKYLFSSIIMFCTILLVSFNLKISASSLIIIIVVGFLSYLAMMILIKDENLKVIINFIYKRNKNESD